jgi:putative oxidoreductase
MCGKFTALASWSEVVAFSQPLTEGSGGQSGDGGGDATAYIDAVGLPLAPLGWAIAILFEVGGGVCLILGFRTRVVAFGLSLFTLAAAVFFHNKFSDQNQMIHFLKNIMLVGGLLQIAHFGAGQYSLDALRSPKSTPSSI